MLYGMHRLGKGMDISALRHLKPYPLHGLLEELPVLCLIYGLEVCAYQFYAVFVKDTAFSQGLCGVQGSLASHGRKEGIRPLLYDDLFNYLWSYRLYVSPVRKIRVGHNGGRVRVYQYDLITLLLKRLAGLGPGVIKLAPLANDYRPGPYYQYFVNVCAFRQSKVSFDRLRGQEVKRPKDRPFHPLTLFITT